MQIKRPIPPKDLIKISDLAEEKGVTRLKIYKMIQANKLDYVKVGNSPIVVKNGKLNNVQK